MDRGAWQATAYGVAKSQTRLSDWSELKKLRKAAQPEWVDGKGFRGGEKVHMGQREAFLPALQSMELTGERGHGPSPHPGPVVLFWCSSLDSLGPGTLCCRAAMLTSDNKTQGNCKGLKITACMHNWGKKWTKRYKNHRKPNWISVEEQGAKAGYGACPPALNTTRGVGETLLSHPSSPAPGHTPTVAPYKEQARFPHWGPS